MSVMPKNVYKFRISGIRTCHVIPSLSHDLNFGLVPFPIKHFDHLSLGQSFKNRRNNHWEVSERKLPFSAKLSISFEISTASRSTPDPAVPSGNGPED